MAKSNKHDDNDFPSVEQYENARFEILEHELETLSEDVRKIAQVVDSLARALKETQHFAVKIGVSQSRIVDRINAWPFVTVHKSEE